MSPRSWVAPDEAGLGRLAPAAALPGGGGAMALPWLQRFELLLFTAAFLCGAVAAATLTRTQVRGGAGLGVGGAGRRCWHCCLGRPGPVALLLGAGGPGEVRRAPVCRRDASARIALCGSARRCSVSQPFLRRKDESSGVT